MLKAAISLVAILAIGSSAFAQQRARTPLPRPGLSDAQGDTLQMTCAQATQLVQSRPEGVVLKTGPNRWDRYYHDAEFCPGAQRDLVPEFVRTKDTRACHLGFTCEDVSSGQ